MEGRSNYRSRETSYVATAIIQSINDNPSDQNDSSRYAKKWTNSEDILKVEPTRFPDELDMNVRRKNRVKDDSQVYRHTCFERKMNLVLDGMNLQHLVDIQMKMLNRTMDILLFNF